MISICRVTVHKVLEPSYFFTVTFERFADFILKILNTNVLIEEGQKIFNFNHLRLFGEFNYFTDFFLLHKVMFGNVNPKFLSLIFIVRLLSILFG